MLLGELGELDVECSSVALNLHRLREGDWWLETRETLLFLGDTLQSL